MAKVGVGLGVGVGVGVGMGVGVGVCKFSDRVLSCIDLEP